MAKGKYQKWLTPDGRILLEVWVRDGLTDEQIAHNMGITPSTLYVWKEKCPEISESLKKGKEVVDFEVENALLQKAKGYNAEVRKTFKVKEVYYDVEGRRCEKEHLESAGKPSGQQNVTFPALYNAIRECYTENYSI